MSLRYKILAAVIGITVVVLMVVLGVILLELFNSSKEFRAFHDALRLRTVRWVESTAVRSDLYQDSHPILRHEFVRDIIHIKADTGDLVRIKGGREVDDEHIRKLVREAIGKHEISFFGNDEIVIPDPGPPGRAPGALYVSLDIPDFRPHEPLRKVYIVMLFGVVTIILVIYVVLSRSVIRPIERLERAAVRVAQGDYSRPVPTAGRDDEMDVLIRTFNDMMVEVGSFRAHLTETVAEARTQAEAAEKSLVIAQRLAATGKLASGIAHEVNNPLGGMLNAVRMLRRKPSPAPEKIDEYLELIADGLLRVQETVKKILQFTPHKVAPQAVAIESVVKRALALASHRIEREDHDVFVDLPAEATVFGDPHELQQVLLNILINSMDAIQEVGRKGEIAIRGETDGARLLITVSDNGCGMTDEQISQAFDLFYTTKEVGEGTGLGLSIAHNVILNHGGNIRLRSNSGEGTEITITLPLLNGGS